MIKIEIQSDVVRTKSGVSARTGKPYSIREQEAYVHTMDQQGNPRPYPQQLVLSLPEDRPPYPPGSYILAPESFYTNRFNQL